MVKPVIGLTGTRHVRKMSLPGMPLAGVALSDDYSQGIEAAGGLPVVIPYVANEVTLGDLATRLDGLVLTGGEDVDPSMFGEEPRHGQGTVVVERDKMEIALVQMMRAQGKPILGICRGIQIVNVALGGTLYQDLLRQWKGQIQHAQLAARNHLSHRVKIAPDSKLSSCFGGETTIRVNSFHHQAVKNIAPSLQAVAWDAEGLVEAVESLNEPFVLAVQWHPENLWHDNPVVVNLFKSVVDAAKCLHVN